MQSQRSLPGKSKFQFLWQRQEPEEIMKNAELQHQTKLGKKSQYKKSIPKQSYKQKLERDSVKNGTCNKTDNHAVFEVVKSTCSNLPAKITMYTVHCTSCSRLATLLVKPTTLNLCDNPTTLSSYSKLLKTIKQLFKFSRVCFFFGLFLFLSLFVFVEHCCCCCCCCCFLFLLMFWYNITVQVNPSISVSLTCSECKGLLGPVHTTLEEFEKAALFLRLGLPSTLIRHKN